ncbi:hypothetical protein OG749_39780 [Streptomyces nojiriensis]|uniref:hypothetical protein n=1 Tax=Streptomyces nojiriensis TaxID=66374 RepID=UPI002E1857E2
MPTKADGHGAGVEKGRAYLKKSQMATGARPAASYMTTGSANSRPAVLTVFRQATPLPTTAVRGQTLVGILEVSGYGPLERVHHPVAREFT